jgi:hypothetical protein
MQRAFTTAAPFSGFVERPMRARGEGLLTPDESEESLPAIIHRDDFVLLTDDIKYWIVQIEDISLLEAWRNFTLVHFPDGKLLIRRSLGDCERRLDSPSSFAPAGAVLSTSAT